MKFFCRLRQCAFIAVVLLGGCVESPVTVVPTDPNVPASRIISLAPHITELVFAAGAGDKLVGVVDYSDYPEAAKWLPRIGDAFRVDYEAIALLQPDLVLAWKSGTPQEMVRQLTSLGFRVVQLEPARIADIAAELRYVGELTGNSLVAAQRADILLAEMEALRARYADQQTVSVFFQISVEPLFTVTGEHVISDIIKVCGGENIFAGLAGVAPAVSLESVIAANPDVILAAANGADMAELEGWRTWSQVGAVDRNNLFAIDRDLISRSGPRISEGARQLCAALDKARATD